MPAGFENPHGFSDAGIRVGDNRQNEVQDNSVKVIIGQLKCLPIHDMGFDRQMELICACLYALHHRRCHIDGRDIQTTWQEFKIDTCACSQQQNTITCLQIQKINRAATRIVEKRSNSIVQRRIHTITNAIPGICSNHRYSSVSFIIGLLSLS